MTDALSPNIVLTGFMATGKTAVGRRIAALTGRTFVDLDAEIIAKHGSIEEIFANGGEERFRAVERDMVAEFAPKRNQIIATGGGTLLDPDNVLSFMGSEVYTLTASPEEIHQRVLADGIASRPLLAESNDVPATITAMLAERKASYDKFTNVDTTGKSLEQVVDSLRSAGAPIAQSAAVDPVENANRTDQILYVVIGIAFVIAFILFVIVITF